MTDPESTHTRQASVDDVPLLVPLFDAYRVFYGQASDVATARSFLHDRLERSQSVVFVAVDADGTAVGFTQLYPSFSSVAATRTFILNDLYVVPHARRRGVAGALLDTAARHGRAAGASRMSLSTAADNDAARALYAAHGWVRDTTFSVYNLSL